MDTITGIETQKRRGNRRSIFVNGEFVAGVGEEVVFELGLKVGQQVDAERLAEMLSAEEIRRAKEAAFYLLDYKERTTKELERRLLQKGYSEEAVTQVITQLERIDLVNDERYATSWVASRVAGRPMGRTRMTWELRRKGVAPEQVEEALEQIDEEKEYEMALSLVEKKLGGKSVSDQETRRKIAGFLQRRGFGWDVVSRALNRFVPEE